MCSASPPRGAESPGRCSRGTECSCEPSQSCSFLSPLCLSPIGDWECIRDIKEKCCYVASDFKKEKVKASSPSCARKFQLPDGQEITLGPEKFLCPEGLFQADLMGEGKEGTWVSPDTDLGATRRGMEPSSQEGALLRVASWSPFPKSWDLCSHLLSGCVCL